MLQHWKDRNNNTTEKEMTKHSLTGQLGALSEKGEFTQMEIERLKRLRLVVLNHMETY